MKRHGAATQAAWDFSRVEEFWARFSPLSPYGKDEKDARRVLADRGAIEALYEGTEAALALFRDLAGDPASLDRISYHLRRLPRLSLKRPEKGQSWDLVELFQVKKFLANYRALIGLAREGCRSRFGLSFESAALAAALDLGGPDAETFYISDAYDPRLKELRTGMAEVDKELAACKAAAAAHASERHGLDFEGREFLVVPNAALCDLGLDRTAFAIEPYDDSSCLVRLQPGEEEIALAARRDALVEAEHGVEEAVLARLSELVIEELPALGRYVAAVTAFDLARARAELALSFGLVRPKLSGPGDVPLSLAQGRYLPCAWECESMGLRYAPLDLELHERAAVVFGSNMGGKTVALETLVFMQVLAQAGFFVPAASFEAPVAPLIHYVGELKRTTLKDRPEGEGLSGFGFEIRSFVEAWEESREGAFMVLDEFGRTTSSHEAEAILTAVIAALVERKGLRSVFSTHFRGVERLPGVRYLRVRGLDREAARCTICDDEGEPLRDRIRRINGMMEYGLVDDTGPGPGGSDAVAIASLLGLDRGIVARAEEIYDRHS